MADSLPLGSRKWVEMVFATAPARDPQGRSRPTQRFALRGDDELTVAEGGGSSIARSLLESMRKAGLVRRWKLEPFGLNRRDHQVEAFPDIIFETVDDAIYVAEVKASKFLNDEKLKKLSAVEKVINASGMTYLLWTDRWPLSRPTWRLAREMRHLGSCAIPRDAILAVQEAVREAPMTVDELSLLGSYRQHIFAAIWEGLVHIDLHAEFSDKTLVTNTVSSRRFEDFLVAPVESYSWWSSQQEAAFIDEEENAQ